MAIAKRPVSKQPIESDVAQFIAGAGGVPAEAAAKAEPAKGRIATMVRFDAALLAKVDAAAKKRGVSRSAWIQYTLSEALEGQG